MENKGTPRVEWLVLALVVLAALSLDVKSDDTPPQMELHHIEGTIELATQDAMDALGFEGFQPGAIATLNLSVTPVTMTDCSDCVTPPTGLHLSGEVVLTELIDEGGRLGRIEADLSLTHFQETTTDGFTHREWLTLDWDAGDIHIDADISIVHDPPRWKPSNRSNSAFMNVADGQESRTGPKILIHALLNGTRIVEGCLPDSRGCEASTLPDVQLKSTFGAPSEVAEIQFETGGTIDQCTNAESPESTRTWNTTGGEGGMLAPMSLWFEAIGISGGEFRLPGGAWTEIVAEDVECGFLADENGVLRIEYSIEFD